MIPKILFVGGHNVINFRAELREPGNLEHGYIPKGSVTLESRPRVEARLGRTICIICQGVL
jgi:hypothetical protein